MISSTIPSAAAAATPEGLDPDAAAESSAGLHGKILLEIGNHKSFIPGGGFLAKSASIRLILVILVGFCFRDINQAHPISPIHRFMPQSPMIWLG